MSKEATLLHQLGDMLWLYTGSAGKAVTDISSWRLSTSFLSMPSLTWEDG